MSLGYFRQKTRVKHALLSDFWVLLSSFAVYVLTYVGSKTSWLSVTVRAAETSNNVVYLVHIYLGRNINCTQISVQIQSHGYCMVFFGCVIFATVQMLQNKETILALSASRWCNVGIEASSPSMQRAGRAAILAPGSVTWVPRSQPNSRHPNPIILYPSTLVYYYLDDLKTTHPIKI